MKNEEVEEEEAPTTVDPQEERFECNGFLLVAGIFGALALLMFISRHWYG